MDARRGVERTRRKVRRVSGNYRKSSPPLPLKNRRLERFFCVPPRYVRNCEGPVRRTTTRRGVRIGKVEADPALIVGRGACHGTAPLAKSRVRGSASVSLRPEVAARVVGGRGQRPAVNLFSRTHGAFERAAQQLTPLAAVSKVRPRHPFPLRREGTKEDVAAVSRTVYVPRDIPENRIPWQHRL